MSDRADLSAGEDGSSLVFKELQPYPADHIPEFVEHAHEMSISGFQGLDRWVTLYKIALTGAVAANTLNLNQATHLLVPDFSASSDKVTAAQERWDTPARD
ncbi:MAG: hypothetical protein WDW38_000298 [Sanguina aurantia]